MDIANSLQLVEKKILSGSRLFDDSLEVSFTIRSTKKLDNELALAFILTNSEGTEFSSQVHSILVDGKSDVTIHIPIDFLPNRGNLISGNYRQTLVLWPEGSETKNDKLVLLEDVDSLFLFHHIEHFETWKDHVWEIRKEFPLGRGLLLAHQVEHNRDQASIHIKLDPTEFSGGEIRTIETFQRGSFHTSMKLADAPGSITGFFLYSPPDYYHEVDIEVFNDSTGTVLFTVYKDGEEWDHTKTSLGFDPTLNFHEYRMDIYDDGISFYVDNELFEHWEGTFQYEPMQLMINSWYPNWLEPEITTPQKTIIDWVKF